MFRENIYEYSRVIRAYSRCAAGRILNTNDHELNMRSALPLATEGTQELFINYLSFVSIAVERKNS